eukprot:GFUD01017310.1.p1 GENE.GFUD01017310.1~~GFUD01017310.1.p1  ORF type:complete len:667 (+),score=195.32 GFUD01017310.1:44-2002(+)
MAFKLKLERGFEYDTDDEEEIKYGPPSSRNVQPSPKYRDLPRVKDEKPLIGPRSSSGNIKVLYPAQVDGYGVNHDELAMMDALGLPTGFSFGNIEPAESRQTSRGAKKTFYCNTCKIELNSEDTMTSHLKGVKHMKKQLAFEERSRMLGHSIPVQAIIPIPNPEPTKKKVPIRLEEKIRETRSPIVGLDFIKEFIPVSDSEMEPHYECSICDSQGQANGMIGHLNGQKHRQAFFSREFGNDPGMARLSQAELLKMAASDRHNENKTGFTARIITRYSDEEYPWPAGKEPWSELRGGSGIVPDRARNNYGNRALSGNFMSQAIPTKEEDQKPRAGVSKERASNQATSTKQEDEKPRAGESNERASNQAIPTKEEDKKPRAGGSKERSSNQKSILPAAERLEPPKNLLESEKMMDLAQHLIMLAADFSGLKHNDRGVLQSCFAALSAKIMSGDRKRTRSRSSSKLSTSPPALRRRTRSPSAKRSHRNRNRSNTRNLSPPSKSGYGPREDRRGGCLEERSQSRSPGSSRSGDSGYSGYSGRMRSTQKLSPPLKREYGNIENRREGFLLERSQTRSPQRDSRSQRRDSWSSNDSRRSRIDYQERRLREEYRETSHSGEGRTEYQGRREVEYRGGRAECQERRQGEEYLERREMKKR